MATATAEPRDTVVLVTGEDNVRRGVSSTLEKAGFSVLFAASADTALKLCRESDASIGLVIIDNGTAQMNGSEFLESLHQVSPGIRVLFMSDSMAPESLGPERGRQVRAILRKPFRRAQLLGQVLEVMGEPLVSTA